MASRDDIIRQSGASYQPVPKVIIPSVATAATATTIAPATTLPASPTDGQQAILVDSTSAPTYAWLFQYLLAASEWIFLGGSPASSADNTNTARSLSTNGSYQDFTGQPTFTIPRAGKYVVRVDGQLKGDSGGLTMQLSFAVGSTASSDNDSSIGAVSNSTFGSAVSPSVLVTAAASDVVKVQCKGTTGHTATVTNASLTIIPITVT